MIFGAHGRLWFGILAISLLFPVLLKYVLRFLVAPIRMHKKHRLAARVNWEPTTPAQLTPEARDFIGRVVPAFRESGFEVVANVSQAEVVPNMAATQLLFVNRRTGDFATALNARAQRRRSFVLVIHSHFADGFRISTGSKASAGFLPKNKADSRRNFPWVSDPAVLDEVHRRRVNRAGRAAGERVTPAAGEELSHFAREWERAIHWHIQCGYFKPEPRDGFYRFTWKGAFMATWKLQDPFQRWGRVRQEREARREWHDLGMDPSGMPGPEHPARPPVQMPFDMAHGAWPQSAPRSAVRELAYQATLAPGEMRSLHAGDGSVTVSVGNRTLGQTLAWQWQRLIAVGVFLLLLILTGRSYLFALRFGFLPIFSWFRWWIFAPPVLLAWEISKLVRVVRRVRGITIVHASADGIRFREAPGFPATGFIARSDIESLVVVPQASPGLRPNYRLEARQYRSSAHQVVLLVRDKKSASDARDALLEGLGITVASEKS